MTDTYHATSLPAPASCYKIAIMRKLFLFGLISAAALAACKKDGCKTPSDLVCMERPGTQCSDPWSRTGGGSKPSAVEKYLAGKGIHARDISVEYNDPGIVCAACSCPSGETVYIKVAREEVKAAEAEGFATGGCDATNGF